MRCTQPLNAQENAIDLAMRKQHRTHEAQDAALTVYRLAVQTQDVLRRAQLLEASADLILEVSA